MRDYQESMTTWQIDRCQTKWSLCAAMLCRRHKHLLHVHEQVLGILNQRINSRDFFLGNFGLLYKPKSCSQSQIVFIRPSSDGTYYAMVMSVRPGLRPGLRPSIRLSVRPISVRPFSALFSYMLWHIELKFCTWLCFDVLHIKFDCRHFASIF